MNWTSEQRRAFESRNQNLLLSAAAGSGKTAVLVKRIISLIIEDHIPIDEMLIITFTKAAAGEMRERILEGLTNLLKEKQENQEFIQRQISMVGNANISTIHSFCMEVIKRNFHKINIDPSFRILDTTEKELLFLEVVNAVLENAYSEENENFIDLVESYTSNRSDKKLVEIIDQLYSFMRSKAEPFKWLEDKISYYSITPDNYEGHLWIKTFKNLLRDDLLVSKKYLEEAVRKTELVGGPIEYKKAVESDLKMVCFLVENLEKGMVLFINSISDLSYERLGRISKNRKAEIDEGIQSQVKELRKLSKDNLNKIAGKIGNKAFIEQIEDLQKIKPMMLALEDLLKTVDEKFKLEKLEENVVDFSDLEQYALALLKDDEINEKYKNKFKYIFVDEYQDTNSLQEEIVNLIKRENNVFLVGDVKQSIYKFRLAEPELFLGKYRDYSSDKSAINRKINLTRNFRTRVEILNGINFIFNELMSETFGEIEYNKEAYLYKGLDFLPIENANIEINIVNGDKKLLDTDTIDDEILDLKTSETEALAIIQRIKKLIGQETFDRKTGELRPIKYSDIVVLMRATSGWGPIFEEKFIKEGIPLYYEGGTGYLESIEIEIFLNILKVIDNRRNDVALLSVLRSSFGGFSIDEIIKIRLEHPAEEYFDSLLYISKGDTELAEKANIFIKKLDFWYETSRYLAIDSFIEKLLRESNFLNYVSALPGGNLRRGNLKLLIQKAKIFNNSSSAGLFYFVKFIEKMGKISADFDTANVISEKENVVRLMSIHKSKGLEFPVVFIARGNRQMRSMSSRSAFSFHKNLGIGTDYIDHKNRVKSKTFAKYVIDKKIHEENLAEEMRILYVGMTRSIDRLLIFGTYTRGFEKAIKEWTIKQSKDYLRKSKSYMEWIMKIISNNADAKIIYDLLDKDFIPDGNDLFKINIIDLSEIQDENENESQKKIRIKDVLKNRRIENSHKIDELLNTQNSITETKKPLKLSVTNFTSSDKNNNQFRLFNSIPQMQKEPSFVTEKVGLSPFDIGNTYHYIMEQIDLTKVSPIEVKEQIDEIYSKGYINKDQKDVLNIDSIVSFYDSTIGNRLIKSGEVKREVPFTYKYNEDLFIQGIIDLYFTENDSIIIVDYKTDKINSSNEELLVEEHSEQVKLYAEALEKITGMKVKEKYLYFFKNQKFYCV
ncbi:MAG TPA: helicase-exonuclease AddAB subunit AddA [Clostridia bacterium]|nr:helicase-exonuclease AddAB subunit AddA [Clostridia bacterium]